MDAVFITQPTMSTKSASPTVCNIAQATAQAMAQAQAMAMAMAIMSTVIPMVCYVAGVPLGMIPAAFGLVLVTAMAFSWILPMRDSHSAMIVFDEGDLSL